MNRDCVDLDRLLDSPSVSAREEKARLRRHLEGCDRCRRQAAADELLRAAFQSPPSPSFSPDFEEALHQQLGRQRPSPALGRLAWGLLVGYASAAAGLSVWILARIDWTTSPLPEAAGALLALVALISPVLLLPRSSPFAPPGLG